MPVTSEYLATVREMLWAQESFRFIPDRDLPPPSGPARRHGGGPRVVFTGFPSDYSLAFLLALLDLDVDVVGLVTSPGAHPAILGENALSRLAAHLEIPLLRLWRVNDEHSRLDLAALQPDGVVMASFDQIVQGRTLAVPPHGWMNIHPSALPHYRGPEPVYWAIADGAATAGITLHRAVPRVDAGPILAARVVEVGPADTAGTLTRHLCAAGVEALPEAVAALMSDVTGTEVDVAQGSYRGPVGHRRLEQAPSAVAAERMVRAGVPNMPAWTAGDDGPVYALAARLVAGCDASVPGTCLSFADGGLELTATARACGCHHDATDCPHLEDAA